MGCSLEEHHVAVIPVGGLTFKHFLPLFGAGLPFDHATDALARPVACLVDADPSKKLNGTNEKFRTCYPYEVEQNPDHTYKALSDAINTLETLKAGRENILIEHGVMTLEYDLALDNHTCAIIVTDSCTHAEALRAIIAAPATTPDELAETLTHARAATGHLAAQECAKHVVATCYLDSVEKAKGEHALALAKALKDAKGTTAIAGFRVPSAIAKVIRWASRQPAVAPAA
jgi:putative ATP-dependent endonuclease of OLD family